MYDIDNLCGDSGKVIKFDVFRARNCNFVDEQWNKTLMETQWNFRNIFGINLNGRSKVKWSMWVKVCVCASECACKVRVLQRKGTKEQCWSKSFNHLDWLLFGAVSSLPLPLRLPLPLPVLLATRGRHQSIFQYQYWNFSGAFCVLLENSL